MCVSICVYVHAHKLCVCVCVCVCVCMCVCVCVHAPCEVGDQENAGKWQVLSQFNSETVCL